MNKKKVIALILVVVLAFGAGVAGTLAWLKDSTKTVKNTFTTGKVDISLYEHVWDDEEKKLTEEKIDADETQEGNEYTILPGSTIQKDPWIEVNKGSEDAYVGAVVSVKNATKLVALLKAGTYDPAEFFGYDSAQGMVDGSETGWKVVAYKYADGTLDILFVYTNKTDAPVAQAAETVLPNIFETISVPKDLEEADMAELAQIEIDVTAYAIQSANIEPAYAVTEMMGSFDALAGLNTNLPAVPSGN